MKRYIIAVCIILVVAAALIFSWEYIAPPRTVSQICSVKADRVDKVILLNGNNGHKTDITDKDKIKRIFAIINSAKYKYHGKNDRNGFVISMDFYSAGKRIGGVGFASEENMFMSRGCYAKTSGGFNIDELLGYID